MTVDTNSLRYLPRLSSNNCDLPFANNDRQTDRHMNLIFINQLMHISVLNFSHYYPVTRNGMVHSEWKEVRSRSPIKGEIKRVGMTLCVGS